MVEELISHNYVHLSTRGRTKSIPTWFVLPFPISKKSLETHKFDLVLPRELE